jgi:hypothetical protein
VSFFGFPLKKSRNNSLRNTFLFQSPQPQMTRGTLLATFGLVLICLSAYVSAAEKLQIGVLVRMRIK